MNLETLRANNPGLQLDAVTDAAFAPYGRVLPLSDASALRRALNDTPVPETGNQYVASLNTLEAACEAAGALMPFGGMATQAGYCNGRGHMMNALEYHKCSEVNFSTTGLVLLLALPEDVRHGRLDAAAVRGFYLPPDVAIEVYPRVLHFAPCRIGEEGFKVLVVLENGTNTDLDCVDTSLEGEAGMLWMRNKWLLAHPESKPASNGAFIGIRGENTVLNI